MNELLWGYLFILIQGVCLCKQSHMVHFWHLEQFSGSWWLYQLPEPFPREFVISTHNTQHIVCCQGSKQLYFTTKICVIVLLLYHTTMSNQQLLLKRIGAAKKEKVAALRRGTSGAPKTIAECFRDNGTLDECLLHKFNQRKA